MNLIKLMCVATLALLVGCEKNCESNPANVSKEGCGDFFVYGNYAVPNEDNTFITFQVYRDSVNLTSSYQAFDLATNPYVKSNIESFNLPDVHYCNDLLNTGLEITNSWEVQSGKVEVRIVRPKNECETGYVVDVRILNATYQDTNGNQVIVSEKMFDNVVVGGYAG